MKSIPKFRGWRDVKRSDSNPPKLPRLSMFFQQILVALNRSPLADRVFDRTLDLVGNRPVSLKFLHFIAQPIAGASFGNVGLSPLAPQTSPMPTDLLVDRTLSEARQWLETYLEKAKQRGIWAEGECNIGEPGFWICELARKWDVDLIIVGRRGRQGIEEAVLGSVSNYVVHHPPCSVLAIQGESA